MKSEKALVLDKEDIVDAISIDIEQVIMELDSIGNYPDSMVELLLGHRVTWQLVPFKATLLLSSSSENSYLGRYDRLSLSIEVENGYKYNMDNIENVLDGLIKSIYDKKWDVLSSLMIVMTNCWELMYSEVTIDGISAEVDGCNVILKVTHYS